jgi:hypothetical protein
MPATVNRSQQRVRGVAGAHLLKEYGPDKRLAAQRRRPFGALRSGLRARRTLLEIMKFGGYTRCA